ncbi:hypothetical protein ACFCXP_04700 [Streptomyces niveus]|uniref:hypothetical protein n=1 Tax=Streptomyces niveus TaxID=193462 RepID=UPI0035DA43C7
MSNLDEPLHGRAGDEMRDRLATSYTPLHNPERDCGPDVPPVDLAYAISQARKVLAEKAPANIHQHDDMIRAAVGLDYTLRSLLAALDAEGAR